MIFRLNNIMAKNIFKKVISRTITTNINYEETVDLAYSYHDFADNTSTKPPLITFHGLIGSKTNWLSLSEVIHKRTGRKVINIDARNHGDSQHSPQHTYIHMAHDVINLLKKLEIPKVSVIGHSMGGRTAMALSLLRPDLISNIIVIEILPIWKNLQIEPQLNFLLRIFDIMSAVPFSSKMTLLEARELADEYIKAVNPDINIRNYVLENLVRTDAGSFTWRINIPALKKSLLTDMIYFPPNLKGMQYKGPALFIAGSLSNYIEKHDMPEVLEYFPRGELTVIEGGGHWVHTQKSEKFLEIICKFLKEN